MEWAEQFEIFEKIISQRLAEHGEKFTQSNAAEFLGIPLNKYRAWKNGQRPVAEDLRMLAQEFEFKADWLLLGIGEPIQPRLDNPFDSKFVEICDTLHELVRGLPDKLPKIAEVGGISSTDLYNCIHTQAFPPSQAVAKWILHYRINANFLLAQIGQPFLSEEEFRQSGPLDFVRDRRGDFLDIDDDNNEHDDMEGISCSAALIKENQMLKDRLLALQGELLEAQKELLTLHKANAGRATPSCASGTANAALGLRQGSETHL